MAEGTILRNLTDEQRGALTNQGFFWLAASENHTYEEAIKIFGTKAAPPAPRQPPPAVRYERGLPVLSRPEGWPKHFGSPLAVPIESLTPEQQRDVCIGQFLAQALQRG